MSSMFDTCGSRFGSAAFLVGQDGILRPIGNRPLARRAAFCCQRRSRQGPSVDRLDAFRDSDAKSKPVARVAWHYANGWCSLHID